ncbi:methyl-accepting chemotaxis protein [Paraburkholderia caballeronis]|uniref:Methyl-accepting chemotaxis sensory transducer with Cache sensor n=1 Tax=Paraburkholderia caballeronis TaxID=416943 RepID=A0A1H7LYF8_9BURK|nr:methyl-accepting chemotaxis protein [Paraburkholderia caballeronis]PXW28644.1 methyl-accepting chemotaxis sensory transducer with Cache sensor [Paraburkholderia caballeronis]PXX04010.1 methyl-accepting chemotaxis sensory transducer with Cache sensor [Paraburkholderia caballeronis]RAK04754.1 methyl-accepting chemotaxis sensory transducer with Cache sensor [Paraburkholderia caballeronis]SED66640.1 methyl-accepting chemotaxis sensory transducer with Cache sensor [Paraburkholderia caballeronis]
MKLSFIQKLWLPLVLSLICLAGISIYDAYEMRAIRVEERKADLEHVADTALSVVKTFGDQAAAGSIPVEEAQKRAMESIRNIRYGGGGYVTIFNSHPTMLMHPTSPQMNGKDLNDYQGPNGDHIYQNIVTVIRRDGKGFISYQFPRPGAHEAAPKISYAVSYQPWDWILNTGVYVDDLDAAFRASLYRGLEMLVVLAAVLAGVVVPLNRGIFRSLGGEPSYAAEIANQIANNDLTVTVNTTPNDRSSLLYSMKRMQEQLSQTIGTIKTSAESIATATYQIAAGNQNLSQRTEEQAASLEETASSMEELTSAVTQNADNAGQANQLAANAAQAAQQGGVAVSRVVETMDGINASSDKIANIVGLIEGIAFQTNILALNAAVEAARAGEQGRGFAVVASEVRSLAQRCSGAAKEIKELIDDSVSRVQTGAATVRETGEKMNEITREIQRVADIMGEISAASREQSKGIGQVNLAITQMDEVVQQNAALVEEAAAAAGALESQAKELKSSVSMFRLAASHEAGSAAVAQPRTKPAAPARKPAAARSSGTLQTAGSGDWNSF